MSEVQNKWSTLKLNDDIWAKLIYFEHNRRLAKAYVSAPVLTVDGSGHGLDGFRIGLSGIENNYRSLDSMASLRSIGHGVKLKIDSQGNILIRKLAAKTEAVDNGAAVYIKDWPSALGSRLLERQEPGQHYELFASNWRELKQTEVSYKLFDMRHFRRQLARMHDSSGQQVDWRQCVSVISFVRQRAQGNRLLLEDPCWLMLINIIAIDMIKSTLDAARRPPSARKLSSPLDQSPRALHPAGRRPDRQPSRQLLASATDDDRLKRLRVQRGAKLANQRRYHSNQQLASDNGAPLPGDELELVDDDHPNPALNSIYTTFNGKLAHASRRLDRSGKRVAPTSGSPATDGLLANYDYGLSMANPRVASTCNRLYHNYMDYFDQRQEHQHIYGSQSLLYPLNESLDEASQQLSGRNSALPSNRNLSLSTCDLRAGDQGRGNDSSQRLELRAMRSAIRMNFDTWLSEDEDQSDGDGESIPVNHLLDKQTDPPTAENLLKAYQPAYLSSNSSAELRTLDSRSLDAGNVNHHECSANEDHPRTPDQQLDPRDEQPAEQRQPVNQKTEAHKMKADAKETTSSAASSSSSGCGADNDYFMSQSSSSMSSSTASNDRELFSQPASTSGIAHSTESTSDEGCPEERKRPAEVQPADQLAGEKLTEGLDQKTTGTRPPVERPTTRRKIRASTTKTIEPPACQSQTACCCKLRAAAQSACLASDHELRQDYSSCHCCCGCFSTIDDVGCDCPALGRQLCSGLKTNPLLGVRSFGGSQANLQHTTLPAGNKPRMRRPPASKTLAKLEREFSRISNSPVTDSLAIDPTRRSTRAQTLAPNSNGKMDTKENATTRSNWLGSKHYSKILPKFMLPSTYNKLKETNLNQGLADSHGCSKNHGKNQIQSAKGATKNRLSRSALELS